MVSKQNNRKWEIEKVSSASPHLWINDSLKNFDEVLPKLPLSLNDIEDAEARLIRFAPLISNLFEDTREMNGIIESQLIPAPNLKRSMSNNFDVDLKGRFFVKGDHDLPVAGSVKARGGIYEVLHFAEGLAVESGLFKTSDPYLIIKDDEIQSIFEQYTVSVGSTGNLGLSIGISASALGLNGCVHMSSEAKDWKKRLLREKGVKVIEYEDDYSFAVKSGREAAADDPFTYFVDDENSRLLFLGYAVSAFRLKNQLNQLGITVDSNHPLFVYLPCGVGGAPGGITFGLKHIFGNNVHCFFAEPVNAPAFLLGMLTNFEEDISIYDFGLNNITEADGLSVSSPSRLVGSMVKNLVSGLFTVADDDLFRFLYMLKESEAIKVEPSATAGFMGPIHLQHNPLGMDYIKEMKLAGSIENSIHILWSTGGSLIPDDEYVKFLERGNS